MGAPRIRKATTEKEYDTLIDDYITQGYKVLSRGEKSSLLKKKDNGSLGAHIILALLTWGIGNLIYWGVKSSGADQVQLKLIDD